PYFPREMDKKFFALAHTIAEDPALLALSDLARELQVVLPVSFFERLGDRYFNSLVTFDADGGSRGVYRKMHIPDGTGYEEKFYGTSFVADPWGEVMGELSRTEQGVLVQTLDLAAARKDRDWMGLLKDRRPDAYGELTKPLRATKPG